MGIFASRKAFNESLFLGYFDVMNGMIAGVSFRSPSGKIFGFGLEMKPGLLLCSTQYTLRTVGGVNESIVLRRNECSGTDVMRRSAPEINVFSTDIFLAYITAE